MINLAEFRNDFFLQLEYSLATGRTIDNLIKRCEGMHGNTQFNSFLQQTSSSSSPIDWLSNDDSLNASISGLRYAAEVIVELEDWLALPFREILHGLDKKHYVTTLEKIFNGSENENWRGVTKRDVKDLLIEFDWWCLYIDSLEVREGDLKSARDLYNFLNSPLFNQLTHLVDIVEIASANWDVDEKAFDNIVKNLDKSNKKFNPEWLTNAFSFNHYNFKTHREYSSLYSWLFLSIFAQAYQYKTNMWATKRQWESLGFKLKQDARPAPIFHYFKVNSNGDDIFQEEKLATFGQKISIVYNADGVEGELGDSVANTKVLPLESLEKRIENLNVKIEHVYSVACYHRDIDLIMMPHKETFRAKNATKQYYATLLHELVHWTGHESRCNRKFGHFGDEDYSFEELVAELGSSFLCARFDLIKEVREESIAYIKSWLSNLDTTESMQYLERAARLANRASNYIYVPKNMRYK
ncbi:TPA: zincin-like metallopeptidase domain-containing protein [Photobacterium damselae]